MSGLANVIFAVANSDTMTDEFAARLINAARGLAGDDPDNVCAALLANPHLSPAFAGAYLHADDGWVRRVCHSRDDLDEAAVCASLATEPLLDVINVAAGSRRPAVLQAVTTTLVSDRFALRGRSNVQPDRAVTQVLQRLATNDRLDPGDAGQLAGWLARHPNVDLHDRRAALPAVFIELARRSSPSHPDVVRSLFTSDARIGLIVDVWAAAGATLDEQITDIAMRRTIIEPVANAGVVPSDVAARLRAVEAVLTASQRTRVAAAVAASDLTGCDDAGWLRSTFLVDEDRAARLHRDAAAARDPETLTALFGTAADFDPTLARIVATNSACPADLALRCVRHLSVDDIGDALGWYPGNVEWLSAIVDLWAGVLEQVPLALRPAVALTCLGHLAHPWDDEASRCAALLIGEVATSDFAQLPLDTIAVLADRSPRLAAWATDLFAGLTEAELVVLTRLADRGDHTLCDLIDVAHAVSELDGSPTGRPGACQRAVVRTHPAS